MDIKTLHSLPVASADFEFLGYKVYSAVRKDTLYAVWDSQILDVGEGFVSWSTFDYTLDRNSDSDKVYVYIKTSDDPALSGAEWSTPYVNQGGEITSTKRYLAMRIVIASPIEMPYNYNNLIGPVVSEMSIFCIVTDTASILFTKTFDLGFFPKTVVTTVTADVPPGSVLDVGITSLDSIAATDYQFFSPDSVVNLDQLAITGKKFKMMLRMSGSGSSSVTVHEFAAMFSGSGQVRLNQ